MPPLPFAADFLAGSLLSLLLPAALVVAVAVWHTLAIRHASEETPRSAPALPSDEVLAAGVEAGIESAGLDPEPPPPPGPEPV
jgi:hypothetical protein